MFNISTLRKLFKVDPADYMLSLCGDDALRELSSPGKSGSFFYLTNDDRYMIKTMKKAEVKVYLLLSFSKLFLSFLNWQNFVLNIWITYYHTDASEDASSLLQSCPCI